MNADLTLGEYIRRLRRQQGWGLEDFAAATQLSVSHLSRIENDKAIPNADTVVEAGDEVLVVLDPEDLHRPRVLPHPGLVARRDRDHGALVRMLGQQTTAPQGLVVHVGSKDQPMHAGKARAPSRARPSCGNRASPRVMLAP